MGNKVNRKTITTAAAILVAGLFLGVFTTSEYVTARGLDYLEHGNQIKRHHDIMEGHAGDPWQYRVLAPYMINVVLACLEDLHVSHHVSKSFILFRVVQDTCVLILAFIYYRRLGLSVRCGLIGMALLAWGMSYSHYDSDLQFSIFFDIIFYLLAGCYILEGKYVWVVPVTFLAAINRESSGFIPFMLLSVGIFAKTHGSLRKAIPAFVASLTVYVVIFFGLRLMYDSQTLTTPYGHSPGIDLLQYNLFREVTWQRLIATLSIIPIIAMSAFKKWPPPLRAFFWAIVPLWFTVHALGAVMAETRLFLVPQAMVFIPGALACLTQLSHQSDCAAAPAPPND